MIISPSSSLCSWTGTIVLAELEVLTSSSLAGVVISAAVLISTPASSQMGVPAFADKAVWISSSRMGSMVRADMAKLIALRVAILKRV